MGGYLNINEAEREELEECFFALDELLEQLYGIGIPDWEGAEGLSLLRALKIVAAIKGEEPPEEEDRDLGFNIRWTAEDILALRPDWTLEEREEWLQDNWGNIRDRSVELGWEIIENLLPPKGEKP